MFGDTEVYSMESTKPTAPVLTFDSSEGLCTLSQACKIVADHYLKYLKQKMTDSGLTDSPVAVPEIQVNAILPIQVNDGACVNFIDTKGNILATGRIRITNKVAQIGNDIALIVMISDITSPTKFITFTYKTQPLESPAETKNENELKVPVPAELSNIQD